MTVLIGYARVSKADGSQVIDLQRDALVKAGVDLDHHLYTDAASGKRDDRPGLDACIKALRHGDTLVVWKLDRLGRDLRHLVNLVGDLTKRGIGLKVLAGEGASIDTTTANGRLVFAIFAGLAEFERELIVERTKAGRGACSRTQRRSPVQDDARQAAPRPGRDGQAGNQGRRAVRRTRHHPPDALSTRHAQGRDQARWREVAGKETMIRCHRCSTRPFNTIQSGESVRLHPAPA